MADKERNGAGDPVATRLDELRRAQQESESNAKFESERAKKLRTELEDLTKAKVKLEKALEEYRVQLGDLEERRTKLWHHRDQQYEAARCAIGQQQARELAQRYSEYNKETGRREEELAEQRSELWQSQSALDNAARELAAAQESFASLSARTKTIGERFSQLEELKGRLGEPADDAGAGARRFVLALEFDTLLRNAGRDPGDPCQYWEQGEEDGGTAFYSVATYRGKLVGAWAEVNAKQEALRQAQETDTSLRDRIERLQVELEARRESRVDSVVAQTDVDSKPEACAETGSGERMALT
jgi:predicted  nucleic acid-binding Zn-ribbon protein